MAAKSIILWSKHGKVTYPREHKGRHMKDIVQLYREQGYETYFVSNDVGTGIQERHLRKSR